MKNFGNSSRVHSQGVPKIFRAPMYRAHCAVFAIAPQLSHEVAHWLYILKFTRLCAVSQWQHSSCSITVSFPFNRVESILILLLPTVVFDNEPTELLIFMQSFSVALSASRIIGTWSCWGKIPLRSTWDNGLPERRHWQSNSHWLWNRWLISLHYLLVVGD